MEHLPEPLNPTGVIGQRLAELRKSRNGMTQERLAEAMRTVGIDWERVVVAKLEKGLRPFVKVDELLALCLILGISPVDLLVPKDADADQWYQVAPKAISRASNVREWIRGEDVLFYRTEPDQDEPETPFQPEDLLNPTRWMPADRRARALLRFIKEIEDREQK
jgi:transcriptional regulator with XRE-family HTH domain